MGRSSSRFGYDRAGQFVRGSHEATVEMKPWIVEALRAGLANEYHRLAVAEARVAPRR